MMQEEHFEILDGWWKASGTHAPLREMVPSTTFIAELAGTPYLAASLYLTNSNLAWLDHLIGNPSVDKKLRAELAPKLLDYISSFARQLGKTRFFCMSMKRSTNRYYERLGFQPTVQVQAYMKEIR